MKVIGHYESAIENSDERLLNEVFAPQVRIDIPGGASDTYAANTASHLVSQVAKIASGIKYVLTADAGNNWYLLGFEFQVEDQKLQGVDQVHLNEDGKIDQLIGYMRPIPVAQRVSIFYREAGPKDAPTLLLLHGLPSSSRMGRAE
jgi:hypothetical protein